MKMFPLKIFLKTLFIHFVNSLIGLANLASSDFNGIVFFFLMALIILKLL